MASSNPELSSMDSALLRGIDSETMLRTGRSAYDEDRWGASDVLTKGVALTAAATVNSFLNTPAALLRTLGADVAPSVSMGDWGFDSESMQYYEDKKVAIEGAALIAGSLLPGFASLKLLKLAQEGKIGGAMIQSATGIFASREAGYAAKAINAIKAGEATVFTAVRSDMWKAIGFGFGEQALQAGVWEVATLATMKGNYTLEDMSVSESLMNIGKGAVLGGVIGGALSSLTTVGKIKGSFADKELSERMYELFDLKGQLKLLAGDKVDTLWSSMLDVADMTGPITKSAASKYAASQRQAVGQMTDMLIGASKGDNRLAFELTTRMQEHVNQIFLEKGKTGAAELLENVFSGVKSIGRINEQSVAVQTAPTHMISFARGGEDFTKGFFKQDPAHINNFLKPFDPAVADDAAVYLQTLDGAPPKVSLANVHHSSSKEAFDNGMDVFITRRGNVLVNPSGNAKHVALSGRNKALNVKQASERVNVGMGYVKAQKEEAKRLADLKARGVDDTFGPLNTQRNELAVANGLTRSGFLNLATGEILDEPFKHFTIADEGAIDLISKDAIKVAGNKIEQFKLDQPYADMWLADNTANEVSKRWAWASANSATPGNMKALLKAGNVIEENDLPAMEMLRSYLKQDRSIIALDQLENKFPSVRFTDSTGAETIATVRDFLESHIGVSTSFISPADALSEAIKVSKERMVSRLMAKGAALDEIAIKLNLDQTALADMQIVDGKLADYVRPTRVRLDYDISQAMAQDGNIVKGRVEQQLRMQQAYDDARTVASSFFGTRFDAINVEKVGAENATSLGAGQGAFTAANEDALTLGGRLKYVGSQVHAKIQELHQETATLLKESFLDVVKNPAAGAELVALRSQMQRTGSQFMFFTGRDADILGLMMKNGSDFGDNAALVSKLINGEEGGIALAVDSFTGINTQKVKFLNTLLPNEPGYVIPGGADAAGLLAKNQAVKYNSYAINTREAAEALAYHGDRAAWRSTWDESARGAQGYGKRNPWLGTDVSRNIIYFPPIPTERYSHYKFVRAVNGDILEGGEQTSMIFGRTAEELLEKEQLIDKTKYQVLSRQDIKDYKKYMGEYSADLDMNSLYTKSDLKKTGALADKYPRANVEEMMTDMLSWHQKADSQVVRRYTELANPDLFAQLRSLGDQWKSAMQSKFPTKDVDTLANPFDSYIKLGFDVAQKDKLPDFFRWQQMAEDKASTVIQGLMKMFGAGKPTAEQYQKATDAMAQMGMGNPYAATMKAGMEMQAFEGAISMVPKQYLSKFTNAVNSTVATLGIRLDIIQSAINAISTPVMMVLQTEGAKIAALDDLKVKVPGSNLQLPGTSKLMYQAMQDVTTGDARKALIARYEKLGTVRAKSADFVDVYDEIALPLHPTVEKLEAQISKLADMGARATVSDQAEVFTRAWASRVGELLYEKLGYTGKDLDSLVYTFATRVNGNHLTSQRPLVFQGWLGQSIGLYQTYQFNLLQQMFRNVQSGQKKSVVMALGMQQTLFGMQGLPGFHAINQHIIGNASGNTEHHDLYTQVPNYFSKEVGEFLLYGGVASLTRAGVYTRGDISPRNITVLPVIPTDWPGISVLSRSLDNAVQAVQKIGGGADIVPTFLQALEHNGMNRMLQGLAQVAGGQTTTSSGSLLSLTRPPNGGMLDMFSIANAGRILGARPFDEAIALDENYRKLAYKMADTERMEKLGQVVKSKLINGDDLDPDEVADVATKYAAAGGRLETFGRKLVAWEKDAHRSVANQAFYGAQNPITQRAQMVMGGKQLPDYRNSGGVSEVGGVTEEAAPE